MAADIDTAEDGGKAATGKRGRTRLIIIGAAALLAVAVVGGVLFFVVGVGRSAPAANTVVAAPTSFIFNLPEMTVNLNTGGQGQEFMKLSIAFEVADQSMMNEIQPHMAKVIDAFQVYLRELRPSDLQGSAGIYRMKEELLRRVNVAIAPAAIDSILFKEILVQ